MTEVQEEFDYVAHFDLKLEMSVILAAAMEEMEEAGAAPRDIAATLQFAVDTIKGTAGVKTGPRLVDEI